MKRTSVGFYQGNSLLSLLDWVEQTYGCREEVLNACGMPANLLDDPNLLVPNIDARLLFHAIGECSGDPLYAARFNAPSPRIASALYQQWVLSASDLSTAVRRLNLAMTPLLQSGCRMYIDFPLKDVVHWHFRPAQGPSLGLPYEILLAVTLQLAILRYFCPHQYQQAELRFTTAPIDRHGRLEDFLQVPVKWHQSNNAVDFPTQWIFQLNPIPVRQSSVPLTSLEPPLEMPHEEDFVRVVSKLIEYCLAIGEVNLSSVAKRLTMTPRTLQRRLLDHGLQFSAVLNYMRCQRAIHLLQLGLSLEEIAPRIGYANKAQFSRSFKRWYGMSPAQVLPQKQESNLRPG